VSTDAYLDAKAAFEQHEKKLQNFGNFLVEAGSGIRSQPGRVIFSNVSSGVGLPMEASMSRDSISINARDWRTPEQIQEMLAEWHKLRDAMRGAWEAVPQTRREGLKPPPGLESRGSGYR
jgi:hypothetical protein